MKIQNGEIWDGKRKIGEALIMYKFGYHPVVNANVNGKEKEFELDTPDLIAKIADFARENLS